MKTVQEIFNAAMGLMDDYVLGIDDTYADGEEKIEDMYAGLEYGQFARW